MSGSWPSEPSPTLADLRIEPGTLPTLWLFEVSEHLVDGVLYDEAFWLCAADEGVAKQHVSLRHKIKKLPGSARTRRIRLVYMVPADPQDIAMAQIKSSTRRKTCP